MQQIKSWYIPIVKSDIQRIGGVNHQGSRDLEMFLAPTSKTGMGHDRGSEDLYLVPFSTRPGELDLTMKTPV